jgi:hypothetical protein
MARAVARIAADVVHPHRHDGQAEQRASRPPCSNYNP